MENNLDEKENIEVLNLESLSLEEPNKQEAKAKKLPNVLVENVFQLKNKKPQFLPPQAYRYKDIYSNRQDQRIQRYIERERKQREFHSRPMPNFQKAHERQALRPVVHRITMPVTPNVIRNAQLMELKRRRREEEYLRDRREQQRMESLRAKSNPVSSRQALKPANQRQPATSKVKVKPFNLIAEQRVQQRRVFNIQNSHMQEMKRREQEEQRQQAEREANQRQRQLTTFRARPNPFAGTAR